MAGLTWRFQHPRILKGVITCATGAGKFRVPLGLLKETYLARPLTHLLSLCLPSLCLPEQPSHHSLPLPPYPSINCRSNPSIIANPKQKRPISHEQRMASTPTPGSALKPRPVPED